MISVQFRKSFAGLSFCSGWGKKLLPDISFDSRFQKDILSSLLRFLCACYKVDLDDI